MRAWEEYLASLEERIGRDAVQTWLKPITIIRFDAANLHLRATPFQKNWFEEHVCPLGIPLLNNNQRPIRIHWESARDDAKGSTPASTYQIRPEPLDPQLLLDCFLPFPGNEMAYKMSLELSQGAVPSFNPVFYYGPSGSGKTHLLTAIAHQLNAKGLRVFTVRALTFMEHVVQAIRLGLMQEFRKTYREIDVLIVDEIHDLSRKAATQEEFFHTFNTLHTLNRQMIFSAQCLPTQLEEIEPRLISRFEWGIAISLSLPDLSYTIALLKRKAETLQTSLSPEIALFLAKKFSSSPKSAVQALHSLALRSSNLTDTKQVEFLLSDLLAKEVADAPSPEKIFKQVAMHFGIRQEDLTGKSQMREFAQPRQIAMYFCRKLLQMPFQTIGRLFGRDHSTVMSSIKQVEKSVETKEAPYAQGVDALLRKFR